MYEELRITILIIIIIITHTQIGVASYVDPQIPFEYGAQSLMSIQRVEEEQERRDVYTKIKKSSK